MSIPWKGYVNVLQEKIRKNSETISSLKKRNRAFKCTKK